MKANGDLWRPMEANGGKWTQMEHPSTIGSRGDDPGRLKILVYSKKIPVIEDWNLLLIPVIVKITVIEAPDNQGLGA